MPHALEFLIRYKPGAVIYSFAMSRKALITTILILAVLTAGALHFLTAPELDVGGAPISPAGLELLQDDWHPWWHATGLAFRVHAPSQTMQDRAVFESDYAVSELSEMLGIPLGPPPGQLFILARPTLWRMAVELNRIQPDRSAAHLGNEIYIFTERDTPWQEDAIPHEVLHWLLARSCTNSMPLWFEEGLAVHLGREISRAMLRAQQRALIYEREALHEGEPVAWGEVLTAERYPLEELPRKYFYRQSEALVMLMLEDAEQGRLPELLNRMCGSADTVQVLREFLGLDEAGWQKLLDRAAEEAVKAKPF